MSLHVVQGERELVSDCRSLARLQFRGIPPLVAGAARIRVTFQVDADGLLSVSARESSTGVEAAIAVKPSYGLTDEQITQMLRESFDHAKEDVHLRALKEQQVEGGRMLEATEAALREDADLLSAEESAALRSELDALRKTLSCTDHRTIKSGIDRKSTRLNSSHTVISYAVFCLKKKKKTNNTTHAVKVREVFYRRGKR